MPMTLIPEDTREAQLLFAVLKALEQVTGETAVAAPSGSQRLWQILGDCSREGRWGRYRIWVTPLSTYRSDVYGSGRPQVLVELVSPGSFLQWTMYEGEIDVLMIQDAIKAIDAD